MAPSQAGIVPSGSASKSYPKVPVAGAIAASPSYGGAANTMGMDPTQPAAENKPVGPPPMGGFYTRKN